MSTDTAAVVKVTMSNIVSKLCHSNAETAANMGGGHHHDFSASDYLFVSSHVARAFPDLLESALVLSYRSATVSAEQSAKWTGKHHRWLKPSSSVLSSLSTLLTSALLVIGAQVKPAQTLIIMSFNPIFIAAIAFLGTTILHSSLLGVPIAIGIVLVGMVVAYWLMRSYDYHDHSRAVHPAVVNIHEVTAGLGVNQVAPAADGLSSAKRRMQLEGSAQEVVVNVHARVGNADDVPVVEANEDIADDHDEMMSISLQDWSLSRGENDDDEELYNVSYSIHEVNSVLAFRRSQQEVECDGASAHEGSSQRTDRAREDASPTLLAPPVRHDRDIDENAIASFQDKVNAAKNTAVDEEMHWNFSSDSGSVAVAAKRTLSTPNVASGDLEGDQQGEDRRLNMGQENCQAKTAELHAALSDAEEEEVQWDFSSDSGRSLVLMN